MFSYSSRKAKAISRQEPETGQSKISFVAINEYLKLFTEKIRLINTLKTDTSKECPLGLIQESNLVFTELDITLFSFEAIFIT